MTFPLLINRYTGAVDFSILEIQELVNLTVPRLTSFSEATTTKNSSANK